MIARKTSYSVSARQYRSVRKAAPDGAYVVIMLTPTVLAFAAIVALTARFVGYTP